MTTTPNDDIASFADFALALISLIDTPDGKERRDIIHDANKIINNEIADHTTKIQMRTVLRAVRFSASRPIA